MIITRTPLRISLAGGGTDLPAFYTRSFGAVVSFTIDKYVTVAINPTFDRNVRVSYSRTENVERVEDLHHDIVRETLTHFGVGGMEVLTVSDIPGEGSGLGSSSALAVGLSLALRKWTNRRTNIDPVFLAEEAHTIERILCGHPVGKQDHFAAACGGLRAYRFESNEDVIVRIIEMTPEQKTFLENDMMLFWTGIKRKSEPILKELERNLRQEEITQNLATQLRDIAVELGVDLLDGNFGGIPKQLHEGWMLKRRMADGITDQNLDALYNAALRAGAGGGKLLGAGGGGFFLFAGCWNHHQEIERAIRLRHVPFHIELNGSTVIYNG